MHWRRFIVAVVVGSVLAPASIFLLGPRVLNATQEVTAGLLPRSVADVLYIANGFLRAARRFLARLFVTPARTFGCGRRPRQAFLVDVPALVLCTVPAVAVTAWIALRRSRDAGCRCRRCGYILRGISEPRCPECGEAI